MIRISLRLETITTLTLDLPVALEHVPTELCFPNLRHLGITRVEDMDVDILKPFVARHGTTLTSFYLQAGYCTKHSSLITLAPRIRTLAMDDLDFRRLFRSEGDGDVPRPSSFPGLTHIGVSAVRNNDYDSKSVKCHGSFKLFG